MGRSSLVGFVVVIGSRKGWSVSAKLTARLSHVTGHLKPHGEFTFRVLHPAIASHRNDPDYELMVAFITNFVMPH
jgi:hypothetical protein